jgi:type II secretory pathway component GspD/PulD (secretin)
MMRMLGTLVSTAIATVLSLALSGCATREVEQHVDNRADSIHAVAQAVQRNVDQKMAAEVPLYQRVQALWVSDRSVVRSTGDALPPQFNRPFVYKSTQPLTVRGFAALVQEASGGAVNVRGETPVMPVQVEFKGSLRNFVTSTAQQFGASINYDNGVLEIAQTEVRTFTVYRAAYNVSAGGGGGARRDPYAELEATLKAVAPRARITVSRNTNSITVVDAPAAMRDVERLMAFDAEQGAKRVLVRWQLINFNTTTAGEAGIALNYLKAKNGGTLGVSVPSAATASANALSIAMTNPASSALGSTLVLSLLNQAGRATVVRDGLMALTNNDVREYNQTLSLPYAKKTTLATIPGLGTNTNVTSVVPLTEFDYKEIGLYMQMSGTIHDSEDVDISLNLKLEQLVRFKQIPSAGVVQEAPEIAKRSIDGRIRLKHGTSGLFVSDNNDTSMFDRRAGLGLSETAEGKQDQWLILLTPVITPGTH